MMQTLSFSQGEILRSLQEDRVNYTKNLYNKLGYIPNRSRKVSILPDPKVRIEAERRKTLLEKTRAAFLVQGDIKPVKQVRSKKTKTKVKTISTVEVGCRSFLLLSVAGTALAAIAYFEYVSNIISTISIF